MGPFRASRFLRVAVPNIRPSCRPRISGSRSASLETKSGKFQAPSFVFSAHTTERLGTTDLEQEKKETYQELHDTAAEMRNAMY
ncbi:hypothetical protein AVEN_47407-1 [Araneus ventricosus]|uniref:Uncharacterized protein n=1 Tax=Araneus ventricosus TaxID=182803 RepID=A0A4Y2PFP3_ARAVE|nr:hypothetical protein AVEN_47407-1 [Araneus ventricosus]